ncbi:hypothetical protein ABZ341_36175 [Streptomyces sp. NPDC006173]|uniref:hypothetical protein n=1 Tax=Streptomyces sp. NPDC006173 TaxID=3155349 RepID=UPI0033C119C4
MTNAHEWITGGQQRFDSLLGRMIREAAMLETYLETIVKELCGSPYGALLISGESSSRVITACRALVDARDDITEPGKQDLKKLLTESKAAFERRHRYVHGAIAWEGEGIPGTMRSRRLKNGHQFERIDIDDLEALANEFNRLIFAATNCFVLLGQMPHASTD